MLPPTLPDPACQPDAVAVKIGGLHDQGTIPCILEKINLDDLKDLQQPRPACVALPTTLPAAILGTLPERFALLFLSGAAGDM
jgi:hypothetical protein